MSLAELPQVQSLSVREKLELVDELWKAVYAELDTQEATQEERDLLDARWADFLLDPSKALTLDQFKKELNALRA